MSEVNDALALLCPTFAHSSVFFPCHVSCMLVLPAWVMREGWEEPVWEVSREQQLTYFSNRNLNFGAPFSVLSFHFKKPSFMVRRFCGTDPSNKVPLAWAGAWTTQEQVAHGSYSGLQGFSEDFAVKAVSLCKGLCEFQWCSILTSTWPRGTKVSFCFLNRLM